MLEFSRCIRFRVDIANLLHLEAAFHADCIVKAAPDEENILCVCEFRCEPLNSFFVRQHALNLLRQGFELLDERAYFLRLDCIVHAGELDRQRIAGGELRAVRFRGCNRNLRPGERIEDIVRLARDGRADHVYDRQRFCAQRLCLPQRGKAIRRFAGLADDHDKMIRAQDRFAIAKLGRKLHAHGHLCNILDNILRNEPRVIGGTARDDIDASECFEQFVRQPERAKIDPSVFDDAVERVSHGLWLLVNLFHHEVLIARFVGGLRIPFDVGDLFCNRLLIDIVKRDLAFFQAGDLHVADVIHVSGIVQDRGNVRSKIPFFAGDAEDERAVLARNIDCVRLILKQDCKRIRALNAEHRARDCRNWGFLFFFIIVINQFCRDFGVRLRIERVPLLQKFFAQFLIVFDNAVVYADHCMIVAAVRMRVLDGRFPMRRPTRMTDAAVALQASAVVRHFVEFFKPAFGFYDLDLACAFAHGKPRGVITTIFKLG